MRTWLRVLVILLMTLPIAGYVAGTLISTAPQHGDPPDPVRLRDAEPRPDRSPATRLPRPKPTETPSDIDPGGIRVVMPKPTGIHENDGEDTGTDDERADDDGDDRTDDPGEDGDG